MDLLPYIKEMGIAGAVVFFGLFIRSELERRAMTKQLIDLVPKMVEAMVGMKASLDAVTELVRDRARRDAADRRDS